MPLGPMHAQVPPGIPTPGMGMPSASFSVPHIPVDMLDSQIENMKAQKDRMIKMFDELIARLIKQKQSMMNQVNEIRNIRG